MPCSPNYAQPRSTDDYALAFMKTYRQHLGAILLGAACASFIFSITLWNRFMQTQPRHPNLELGLIYSMNNHGWYYYLSATQADQMMISWYASFAFGITAALV